MEEKKNFTDRHPYWIIPILAILVIFQALAIGTTLKKNSDSAVLPKTGSFVTIPKVEQVEKASVELAFVPSAVSIRKGEKASIDLIMTPKRSLRLDGADIVLGFDPTILEISQVDVPKLFSQISQNRESEKLGKVFLTFLEENQGGLVIGSPVRLLTLTVKGDEVGESNISIMTADYGASTVITENSTSKKIMFDKGSLNVVVY